MDEVLEHLVTKLLPKVRPPQIDVGMLLSHQVRVLMLQATADAAHGNMRGEQLTG